MRMVGAIADVFKGNRYEWVRGSWVGDYFRFD